MYSYTRYVFIVIAEYDTHDAQNKHLSFYSILTAFKVHKIIRVIRLT